MPIEHKDRKRFKVVEQFRTLRKAKGYTQKDISEMTGISLYAISSIESGRRNPSLLMCEKLAQAVGGEISIVGFK